jgi:hypothetical protein
MESPWRRTCQVGRYVHPAQNGRPRTEIGRPPFDLFWSRGCPASFILSVAQSTMAARGAPELLTLPCTLTRLRRRTASNSTRFTPEAFMNCGVSETPVRQPAADRHCPRATRAPTPVAVLMSGVSKMRFGAPFRATLNLARPIRSVLVTSHGGRGRSPVSLIEGSLCRCGAAP